MMAGAPVVLVVEDDEILGASLMQRLKLEGFIAIWAKTAASAATEVKRRRPDLILCDIRLPDAHGGQFMLNTLRLVGTVPTIFMTAFAQVDQAVQLVRAGAEDYLTKPFDLDRLIERLREVLGRRASEAAADDEPVVASPAMQALHQMLKRLAQVDSTVLLTGETGVGKEVAARLLHRNGPWRDRPFIAVNCASLPRELADSEIFGHEKGSFTGAAGRHEGFAERAKDGVLFLDEVAELPPTTQAKLLRLVQERRFTRVGGEAEIDFKARIICATNADLSAMVADGTFRKDLYYRINVISVHIPPLRDRGTEVEALMEQFARIFGGRFGRPGVRIGPALRAAALRHDWPGNVRELKNRMERAVVLAEGDELQPADVFPEIALPAHTAQVPTLAEVREEAERRHIDSVLQQTGGRIQEAAERLGISRTTLWERMSRMGITPPD